MSVFEMIVTDSPYLNAEKVEENKWIIHLSNGAEIPVEKNPVDDRGNVWGWRIGKAFWSGGNKLKDEWARRYLEELIAEKLTGKRIIYHARKEVPMICGIDGAACRCKGECNSALCSDCPVAEKFFADRDGVELIYAI